MADQHQHANDPLLGTMFHDYIVESLLTQGGMGAVYLCRHKELPTLRKVLKVIPTELLEEPDPSASPSARESAERARAFLRDRFEREAIAVSQLHHRYIVPIDGIGVVGGRRCILMPFLDGRTLEQVLHERGGCLTPHETLHIAAQIARALDYAHRQGIVHRDLKPGNIFVVPSEDDPLSIKVIDFGIAKQMQAQAVTAWKGPMGTLLFMAVEQFERASEATALADVYSLAVMLYVMITGRYPWGKHHSVFELYRRQMCESPDPAPEMPPGWEDMVFSALSPDPRLRPQSMRAFIYPLALLLPPGHSPEGRPSHSHKSGLEILRAVARRWAEPSPLDETLRETAATSGAWRAAISGAWPASTSGAGHAATSGAWRAATSGSWPAGSWPGTAVSECWPSMAPSSLSPWEPTSATLGAAGGTLAPAIWKLVLLAAATAVFAGIVIFAMVALMGARAPSHQPSAPYPPTTTAPAGL